jgi:phenylacetate-CoA ligase
MNKHFLKSIRDNIPEPLKHITSSTWRNKLVKNKEFCNYYKLLENREALSPEEIKEYQLSQLKKILIYSYQNVPYYYGLFNNISFDPLKFSDVEQISTIPFLTRELINNNFEKLVSAKMVKNGYYTGSTGGSSGLPLKFLLDYDSTYKENAFIYYFRKKLGYRFEDKLATFRQIEFGSKLWKLNPMQNELIFSPIRLSKITISDYANQINEFGPMYFNGYLSTIWYFTKLLEEHQLKLSTKLKGIFLISENIDIKQRNYIEQFYGVKSMTFYGHSERCVIAEEITPNRYKFDPYYGYTETIELENNEYSIVGTGFLNYQMPLIRYKTDDICSPDNQFYRIDGKRTSTDGLYGYNNEFLSSSAFDIEDPVFKNITTYQFIQKEPGKADMLIIVNNDFKMSEMDIYKNEINSHTKGVIDIEIKIVKNLILSPRGKYQMYISKIEEK